MALTKKGMDNERKGIYCPDCSFWNRPERRSCFNCETSLPKKGLMNRLVKYGTLILASITVITLFASIYGLDNIADQISHGELTALNPPPGFAIVREFEGFPSDHIIISVDWQNSWRQKDETIRQPYLILRNSSHIYKFYFMGELPQFSRKYFSPNYSEELSRSGTFLTQPNSVSTHALVFQVDNYWNNKSPNYRFRFITGEKFTVSIGFERWNRGHFEPVHETPYFVMPIKGYVGQLSRESGNYWDYYAINSSTGELM